MFAVAFAALAAIVQVVPPAGGDVAPVFLPCGMYPGITLTKTQPIYPVAARREHVAGTVILRVTIDPSGHTSEVTPVEGPDLLQKAARDAVMQWTYAPYYLRGRPVAVSTLVLVNFSFRQLGSKLEQVSPPRRVMTSMVMAGLLRSGMDPSAESGSLRNKGIVWLKLIVGTDGSVISTHAEEGPQDLVEAATRAVQAWKYTPYRSKDGAAEEVETIVLFDFR